MARDRDRGDSISPSAGQSKRSSTSRDLDSLASDQAQRPHAQQHQQHPHQQQHRKHPQQKHHVGGGGRLHARVPSSKGLIKQNAASSTKLTRRVTSPSPERHTAAAAAVTSSSNLHLHHHRKHSSHSSDPKLARDSSSTNLKKNASQTSLKRNRSHVDVTKRSKSSGQLKRSASEKTVTTKLRPSKSAVHFDLGNDGQLDQDEDDNEWVDASSSASPYLSRRGSVITSGPSSAQAQGRPAHGIGASSSTAADDDDDDNGDEEPTPLAEPHNSLFNDTIEHSRNLTSRLLQRTPSHSATTSMSNMTAMAKAASPDSRHSASTLSVTPALTQPQGIAGSNGNEEVTSRFITSQEGGGSFYTTSGNSLSGKRPQSMGGLRGPTDTGLSTATTQVHDDDDDNDEELTDEEDTGITSAIATTARSRKEGPVAAPSEKSRTQQKINLQRASSSMEPVRHRHSGIGGFAAEVAEVAGPLIGGAGYESQDPRVYKLLERTGVEYNIVRRYQNPVARSLARLTQLPGNDKARRIPRGAPSSRHSVPNFGLSQSFRETASAKRPETPKRAFSTVRHNATGSSLDTDDGGAAAARMHEGAGSRLSGASLVNGEEDEGIQAILRSMWDKNLTNLAASAD